MPTNSAWARPYLDWKYYLLFIWSSHLTGHLYFLWQLYPEVLVSKQKSLGRKIPHGQRSIIKHFLKSLCTGSSPFSTTNTLTFTLPLSLSHTHTHTHTHSFTPPWFNANIESLDKNTPDLSLTPTAVLHVGPKSIHQASNDLPAIRVGPTSMTHEGNPGWDLRQTGITKSLQVLLSTQMAFQGTSYFSTWKPWDLTHIEAFKWRNPSPRAMGWITSLPNPHVKALTPRVTVFEERVYKEVIKVKWDDEGGALVQWERCPYKKSFLPLALYLSLQGHREKAAIHKPGREP